MSLVRYALAVLLLGVCAAGIAGLTGDDDRRLPFGGLRVRGMNVTMATNPTPADFELIRSWGANSVRLVVHGDPENARNDGLVKSVIPLEINEKGFQRLTGIVHIAVDSGLAVIVDMHSWPCRTEGRLWTSWECWSSYRDLWKKVALALKGVDGVVGYDLMNEPDLLLRQLSPVEFRMAQRGRWRFPNAWRDTPKDYFKLMRLVASDISAIDSSKTIIVAGVGAWGKPTNFRWMETVSTDSPVCYTFHMYIPNRFSDQGKGGTGGHQERVLAYPLKGFGEKEVQSAMKDVVAFQKERGVCVYVGEFGDTKYTEGFGGGRWLEDVLNVFEEKGWNWAYWSYSIPLRELRVKRDDVGELVRGEGERLRVLREYWGRNRRFDGGRTEN